MAPPRDILTVWAGVREHFDGALHCTPAPVTDAGVDQLAADLAGLFHEMSPNRRFQLPAEYRRWLPHVGANFNVGGEWGLYFHHPDSVLRNTRYGCETFHRFDATRIPWVEIGHWSDRHDLFLCCDPDVPMFGALVDAHDNHPWLEPEQLYRQAPSLTRYLCRFFRPMRRRRKERRRALLEASGRS